MSLLHFTQPFGNRLLLAGMLLSGAEAMADPVLLRGPYLQKASPTAITVCWRTDEQTVGRVRYGTSAAALNLTAEATEPGTDQKVALPGLTAATKYYYQIEAGATVLAGGTDYHFETPPATGSTGPMRFWVLGDAGTANANQEAVRNAFAPVHAVSPADFILMLGDNAYYFGEDYQYQAAVFDMYPTYLRQLPLWSCIGNHETYGPVVNGKLAYDEIFHFPTNGECGGVASGTERYFSWNYANVHFVSLDSMTSNRAFNGTMATWLAADLEANLLHWTVVLFHHPSYTQGSHNSDYEGECVEMRENILPILEEHGVDLVLNGHSHCYERSYLLDGHYGIGSTLTPANKLNAGDGREDGTGSYTKASAGAAAHEGTVYVVAGSAGQISGGPLNHPAHFVSLNQLGSVIVDVSNNRMDVKFLRQEGASVTYGDYFTIMKGVPIAPAAPSDLAVLPLDASHALIHWEDNSVSEQTFEVQISEDDVTYQAVATVAANVTGVSIDSLVPGETYFVKVKAVNVTGTAISTSISFVQPLPPPPAVSAIDQWRFIHWGTVDAAGERADTADFDHDGEQNLLEYALGTSPRNPTSLTVLNPSRTPQGKLSLTFPRLALGDIRYSVEFSTDLSVGSWTEAFSSVGAANLAGPVTVVDPAAAPGGRKFVRLRVSRP